MPGDVTRDKVIRAAARLLTEEGRDAVTNRSVSAAAGVQPPAIYRQFGDKDGLLDAVATFGLREYLTSKSGLTGTGDPLDDLRQAWDLHVAFGMSQPAFYRLAFGDPAPGRTRAAAAEAIDGLGALIGRVAAAGRLRVSLERATAMVFAAGVGVVMTQLALEPAGRDPEISVMTREAVLASIAETEPATPGPVTVAGRAAALREAVTSGEATGLTRAERDFLAEWLGRIQ